MKKIKDWIIEKLGGKKLTIVLIETKRIGYVTSSITISHLRDTVICRMSGRTICIKSTGEVTTL